ncbi:MAG: SIR2 family protein, partial [Longimicrobiales bacterium]
MGPKPPASLVRYLRDKRCVLFCGSGLSAWAKLPTWQKLLQGIVADLAEELPDDPNREELNRLLQAGKLLEVADHCKEVLGRRYNDILSERLRGAEGDIPEPHRIIAQLPFAAVITTNYDKLLERSYAGVGSLPKTPTHRDVDALGPLLFDGSFFILKAHGDIDRPESMVLTTRDYQEIIHSNPAFNSIFSAILLTKAILFVGYSLNDPDFRLLLDRQLTTFRGNIPERYALITGVGKVERDVLWRTARIRILSYDEGQHGQVLDFLRALQEQMHPQPEVLPSPPPPEPMPRPPSFAAPKPRAAPTPLAVPRPYTAGALPATILSVRMRGQSLQASVSFEGNAVQGAGAAPDWTQLTRLIPAAIRNRAQAQPLGAYLAELLTGTVLRALTEVPADHTITLQLSPEVELLPWEMTEVDGQFLLLRNPLVRAPVGVTDSARGYPIMRKPVRVLLIGDPDENLRGARQEVDEILSIYRRTETVCHSLIGPEASFETVATQLSLGRYDVVHFAGHAWFDEDSEPFLLLSGEVKLRSSELRSLISPHPPGLLILNSHYTIFTPPGAAGKRDVSDEATKPAPAGQRGFIDAASTAGVGILIGSFGGALDDTIARTVGIDLHEALLRGLPVARALHHALLLAEPRAGSNASHLTYAMSGYGDITMP